MTDVRDCLVRHDATLRECVARFAETRTGIVLFVDDAGRFQGLLTAGNVFRLIAQGVGLDDSVAPHINTSPITVTPELANAEILRIMTVRGVQHVPVIRADGTVARLVTQAELLKENLLSNRAVIMAGGEGKRLRPITDQVPKGLVEINGKPLLEHLIERVFRSGILDITIAVRYRASEIKKFIGDGSRWHVNVTYVEECEPLGTCGALRLIRERWNEPFFVLNCDVLSDLDLADMHRFHLLNRSQMTVAVKDEQIEVPFGIVEVDHERVVRLSEKPKLKFYVNAGIYLLNSEAKDAIPDRAYDMTELIADLLRRGMVVGSFPLRAAWFDVGDHESLRRAEETWSHS